MSHDEKTREALKVRVNNILRRTVSPVAGSERGGAGSQNNFFRLKRTSVVAILLGSCPSKIPYSSVL